jgi:conjugal transfer ATP-binding protein TraC
MGLKDKIEKLGATLFNKSREGDETVSADFGESKQTHEPSDMIKDSNNQQQADIVSMLEKGEQVVVFDFSRVFAKVCLLEEAQHIRFEKDSGMCINPFSFVVEGMGKYDINEQRDQLEVISVMILNMVCNSDSDLYYFQTHFVHMAVPECFVLFGRQTTLIHVANRLLAYEDQSAKDVGTLLYLYIKEGPYEQWFEGEANVVLKSNLVVIALDDLEKTPRLLDVVFDALRSVVSQQLYLNDRKRRNVFTIHKGDLLIKRCIC